MKLSDHLSESSRKQLNNLKSKPKKKKKHIPKQKEERLSQRDWEEIMGMKRDTYKRERGAVKRR